MERRVEHEFPSLKSQIATICDEVQQYGQSLVDCEQLSALCEGEVSPDRQWHAIARIAINECLSFTFFPDGGVRFATLCSTSR